VQSPTGAEGLMEAQQDLFGRIFSFRQFSHSVPAGFASLAILQYLSRPALDNTLWVSLYSYIIAIPLLCFGAMESALWFSAKKSTHDRPFLMVSLIVYYSRDQRFYNRDSCTVLAFLTECWDYIPSDRVFHILVFHVLSPRIC